MDDEQKFLNDYISEVYSNKSQLRNINLNVNVNNKHNIITHIYPTRVSISSIIIEYMLKNTPDFFKNLTFSCDFVNTFFSSFFFCFDYTITMNDLKKYHKYDLKIIEEVLNLNTEKSDEYKEQFDEKKINTFITTLYSDDCFSYSAEQIFIRDRKAIIIDDYKFSIHRFTPDIINLDFSQRKKEIETFIANELNKGIEIIKIVSVKTCLNANECEVIFYSFNSDLFSKINSSPIYGKDNTKITKLKCENPLMIKYKYVETYHIYRTSLCYKNYSSYLNAINDFEKFLNVYKKQK